MCLSGEPFKAGVSLMQPNFDQMLPVTIIGGYLGAGKTTLVNRLLRGADGSRLAVLVNEFGALPIDQDLIEAQDDNLISISGGCVCCSYGNDLALAMMELAKLDPPPDHVLLEASGVALPGSIALTVSTLEGYRIDGIVLLADAETIKSQADDPYMGDTITRQLEAADIVILNKTDLVAPDVSVQVANWLTTFAGDAAILPTSKADVPNGVVMQDFSPDLGKLTGAGDHDTGHFETAFFPMEGATWDAERLAELLAAPQFSLLRAKGFVRADGGLAAIQVVGRRWSVSEAPAGAKAGLVVISAQKLDAQAIETAMSELVHSTV